MDFREMMCLFKVAVCYVFGSPVVGAVYCDRDLNLAVVFTGEQSSGQRTEAALRRELSRHFPKANVDVISLEKASIALKFDVISSGRVIYCSDPVFKSRFEEIALRDYLDYKPVLETYFRELEEAVYET
ncbi:MAG: nucleotidyltransferase domain-containing protein [Firmicutes bacterium]|nr:nucleotidyltransferase domain-containing protein [Bacillota bacterium]